MSPNVRNSQLFENISHIPKERQSCFGQMFEKEKDQVSILDPAVNKLDEEVKDSKRFEFVPTSEFIFDPTEFKAIVENSPFNVDAMTPIASKVRPSDTTNLQSQISQSMRKELISLLNPDVAEVIQEQEEVSLIDFSLPDLSINQTLNEMNVAFIQDSNDSIRVS